MKGKVATLWRNLGLVGVISELILNSHAQRVFGFFAGPSDWSGSHTKYRYFFTEGVKESECERCDDQNCDVLLPGRRPRGQCHHGCTRSNPSATDCGRISRPAFWPNIRLATNTETSSSDPTISVKCTRMWTMSADRVSTASRIRRVILTTEVVPGFLDRSLRWIPERKRRHRDGQEETAGSRRSSRREWRWRRCGRLQPRPGDAQSLRLRHPAWHATP